MDENLQSILDIPSARFNSVASALFAYLFGIISKAELYEYVGDKALAKASLERARNSGYVLKHCKLYAYAYHLFRKGNLEVAPKPAAYKVSTIDSRFLQKLNLAKVPPKPAYRLESFDRMLTSVLTSTELKQYTGKLVSKKLSFISKSYGMPREDIESKLRDAAMSAIYKQYPRFESELHVVNICKTTIHNTAMNIIEYHTRDKRQALIKNGDSFTQVHVSIDAVPSVIAEMEAEHRYSQHDRDLLQSFLELMPKMSDEVVHFISCCCGHFDEGFSAFLGSDNGELVEKIPYDDYLMKVKSYFHEQFDIHPSKVDKLFLKFQRQLA